MNKNSRLPLYVIFLLIAVALAWRITNPPPKIVPGPIGSFADWKSMRSYGNMGAQAVNPAGAIWAGAWNSKQPSSNTAYSAIRIVDFNGHTGKSCALPDGIEVNYISWADNSTLRACFTNIADPMQGSGFILVDALEGRIVGEPVYGSDIERIICWPDTYSKFIALTDEEPASVAEYSENGKECTKIGQAIAIAGGEKESLYKDAGIDYAGGTFVFSVADSNVSGGRAYYLADAETGSAVKMFELADVPGRIEGIWPSPVQVLIVCRVDQKLQALTYDKSTAKLIEQPNGVDLSIWPKVPEKIYYTNYNGGFQFDLATGKSKPVFDLSKRNSENDKTWRDTIRDSRLYRLKSGNYVSVSEIGGMVDIREIKPDGQWYRNVLPRH